MSAIRNVVFNTWSGAFFKPGGGEVQLLNSRRYLEKLGYQISNFNVWDPQTEVDLLHQFSINVGIEYVIDGYKALGKAVALSTILWTVPEDAGFREYLKRVFDKADVLLTNSDMESSLLSSTLDVPKEKFFKTRNSISEEYLDTTTDKDFSRAFDIDAPFVLSVANIDTRKNTAALVRACKALGFRLVLVGHIRDQEYYDSFIHDYSGCHYVGPVNDVAMLKSAYQQCQLFALPSLCETPGIAALEAASQGANIVITEEGAAPEYFESLVTYVNPLELDSIVEGLKAEFKEERGNSLKQYVTDNYTWDKTALDIDGAYNKAFASF